MRRLRYAIQCDDTETVRLIELAGGKASISDASSWRKRNDESGFLVCQSEYVTQLLAGLVCDRRGVAAESAESAGNKVGSEPKVNSSGPASRFDKASESVRTQASGTKVVVKVKAPDRVDNNLVLKQLRFALSLRSDDVERILRDGGAKLSKSEVGAFFRKPEARNYRDCGDQVLRQFLTGLAKRRDVDRGKSSRQLQPGRDSKQSKLRNNKKSDKR